MSAEDNVEMINNEEDMQMNQNPNNVPVMVQNQNNSQIMSENIDISNNVNNQMNEQPVDNSDSSSGMNMKHIIILVVLLVIIGLAVWKFMPQIKSMLGKSAAEAKNVVPKTNTTK